MGIIIYYLRQRLLCLTHTNQVSNIFLHNIYRNQIMFEHPMFHLCCLYIYILRNYRVHLAHVFYVRLVYILTNELVASSSCNSSLHVVDISLYHYSQARFLNNTIHQTLVVLGANQIY